jgi:hypothetical protein
LRAGAAGPDGARRGPTGRGGRSNAATIASECGMPPQFALLGDTEHLLGQTEQSSEI